MVDKTSEILFTGILLMVALSTVVVVAVWSFTITGLFASTITSSPSTAATVILKSRTVVRSALITTSFIFIV